MVEAIYPLLRTRLITMNRTDVVGLSIVVPSNNFRDANFVAIFDELLHTGGEEPVVRAENEVLVIWGAVVLRH